MAQALLQKEVLGTGACAAPPPGPPPVSGGPWVQGKALEGTNSEHAPCRSVCAPCDGPSCCRCAPSAEDLESLLGQRPYRSTELRNIDKFKDGFNKDAAAAVVSWACSM